MNKKGTRRANGEGSIYNTIQKIKRPEKLDYECDICKTVQIEQNVIIEQVQKMSKMYRMYFMPNLLR